MRFTCLIICLFVALLSFSLWLAPAQEAVRINVAITDNTAENRNLDAFVAKYGCFVDANADNTTRRAQRRQCREVAILQFMQDVEDGHEADSAVAPARASAIAARKLRWTAGVAQVTPTPTPVR